MMPPVDYNYVTCPNCLGTGWDKANRDQDFRTCPDCSGEGGNWVEARSQTHINDLFRGGGCE